MAAGYYKLKIKQGATFSKTLLLGSGPVFKVPAFSDAGGGKIKVSAPGHIFTAGQYVKIDAYHRERNIIYTGSYAITDVIAEESFTFTHDWHGSISGTVQAARDLTGKSFRGQGRSLDDGSLLVDLTANIPSALGGVVTLYYGAVAAADLSVTTKAAWEGEVYDEADDEYVDPVLEGPMEISREDAKP